MIMAAPFATLSRDVDSHLHNEGSEWSTCLDGRGVSHRFGDAVDHREELVQSGADAALHQLFHMTLSSLRGYQEIAETASQVSLRTFIDVIVRQRSAQCRALARMSEGLIPESMNFELSDEAALADPSAADLQIIWLRTVWTFEQAEFGRFIDNIEQAEMMLEDAFLSAADTFPDSDFAVIFQQHAINICGARQCLDDITGELLTRDRY